MRKGRKPRWSVSYAMKDMARKMVEDVRIQMEKFPDRFQYTYETTVSGAQLELIVTKADVTKGGGLSVVACSYNSIQPMVSSIKYLQKNSWESVRSRIMGNGCLEELAYSLDDLIKDTYCWD